MFCRHFDVGRATSTLYPKVFNLGFVYIILLCLVLSWKIENLHLPWYLLEKLRIFTVLFSKNAFFSRHCFHDVLPFAVVVVFILYFYVLEFWQYFQSIIFRDAAFPFHSPQSSNKLPRIISFQNEESEDYTNFWQTVANALSVSINNPQRSM